MIPDIPFIRLNRLKVIAKKDTVYDENFSNGINIIHGENGSGKSTIADFIFYILGGVPKIFKEEALKCDYVIGEVVMKNHILTLKRSIKNHPSSTQVFWGSMENAENSVSDKWDTFYPKRSGTLSSFSQLAFSKIGIPEAKGENEENITMHQLLRILYSDQQTPVRNLFRDDHYDSPTKRDVVGELLCGIISYESLNISQQLKNLNKEKKEINMKLSIIISTHSKNKDILLVSELNKKIDALNKERDSKLSYIEKFISPHDSSDLIQLNEDKKTMHNTIMLHKKELFKIIEKCKWIEFEISDLNCFIMHLQESLDKLLFSHKIREKIGNINFQFCPSCNLPIKNHSCADVCSLCHNVIEFNDLTDSYGQIEQDIYFQINESNLVLSTKKNELKDNKVTIRSLNTKIKHLNISYKVRFELIENPKELHLSSSYQRLGEIKVELEYLDEKIEIAEQISILKNTKINIVSNISELMINQEFYIKNSETQKKKSIHQISNHSLYFLHNDLHRQEEFQNAQIVEPIFRENIIKVDTKSNFAESSNVILKNSTILGLFFAACYDNMFFHPRFLLMDNIEDKGMEIKRSQNFQQLIVNKALKIVGPHQIIFTTSKINPNLKKYAVGHDYTKGRRVLDII